MRGPDQLLAHEKDTTALSHYFDYCWMSRYPEFVLESESGAGQLTNGERGVLALSCALPPATQLLATATATAFVRRLVF